MRGRNELSDLRQQSMMTEQQRQVILGQKIQSNETSLKTQQEFMSGQRAIYQKHGNNPKSPGLEDELAMHGAQFITNPKDLASYWKEYNEMTPKARADYTSSLTEGRQISQGKRTDTRKKEAEGRAHDKQIAKEQRAKTEKLDTERRAEGRSDMPLSIRQSFEDDVINERTGKVQTDIITGKPVKSRNQDDQDAYAAFKADSGLGWHKAKKMWDKFDSDPAMEGMTLGKKTDKGYEVTKDGAVVGHYN